jgi:hypothetical protein
MHHLRLTPGAEQHSTSLLQGRQEGVLGNLRDGTSIQIGEQQLVGLQIHPQQLLQKKTVCSVCQWTQNKKRLLPIDLLNYL